MMRASKGGGKVAGSRRRPSNGGRRGTRAERVVAAIVVIGIVGAIALVAVRASHHDGPQAPTKSFPQPQAVVKTTTTLKPVRSGRVTAWPLPTALSAPRDVAISGDGTLWVTEQDNAAVDTMRGSTLTSYGMQVFVNGNGPYVSAFGLGAGPGGWMWFTGYPGGSLARILPDGTANGFVPLSDGAATVAVAEGPGDVMWATDNRDALLIRVGPDSSVSQVRVLAPVGAKQRDAQPYDIVRGADGTMWFTDPGTGSVGSVSTASPAVITEHLIGARALPRSIAVAPDGSVWVTTRRSLAKIDPTTGSATLIPVTSADALLNDLVIAPDGSIWLSENGGALLHVHPDGSLIERVAMPRGIVYTDGIAIAADGTIWAAATDANMIVSVAPRA